ncbi:competence protein ComGC [Salirhabdus euzebyi]|uniref:ComG operon protein 3 n=1 Tax=Salirhabdus euzebyi TaxID=394506 RepID=A0A841Q7G1_9BACI|nr:competence type IV pilus major pilin ComGC [Salirhabdus euzebyi]MBB6454257.1 competence protein ComGC [Salirhabdus euzebyi]
MNNEKGFTLIEMLVVLLIISVLLLITIPNVTKNNEVIDTKSCAAFKSLVESQTQVYKIEKGQLPVEINDLVTEGYLSETKCPNGTEIHLLDDGSVSSEVPSTN